MRYAQDHKAQTYQRITREASERFRRDGIGATGLQPLMKSLGLTHGGFYAHFKSKEDLIEKALRCAAEECDEYCAAAFAEPEPLAAFIDMYLSEQHRLHPENGCPLPNMSLELGQRGQPSPVTDEVVEARLASLIENLPGSEARSRSIVMLSTLVGALMLSRSVEGRELSEQILQTTQAWLKDRKADI